MKNYNSNDELRAKLDDEINILMAERRRRLNEVIRANNLTLVELGQKIGVAKSSIQRYLTGETVKIPIDFFEKVAHVTNTPVEYLTCFDEYKKETAPINTNRSDLAEVLDQLSEEDEKRVKELADLLLLKKQVQDEPDNR